VQYIFSNSAILQNVPLGPKRREERRGEAYVVGFNTNSVQAAECFHKLSLVIKL
jgi:hypothetical protein